MGTSVATPRSMPADIINLEQLLDRVSEGTGDQERVFVGRIVEAVGGRSLGGIILLVGIILISPLSGIPGIPTTMGILLLLVAGQLVFHRRHLWLPQWLLRRTISRARLHKALKWLRPLACFVDRRLAPRLPLLVEEAAAFFIALICVVIAVGLPITELVPFSATAAGTVLAPFGLALIAHDGLLALLAFVVTATYAVLIVSGLQ